MSPDPPTSKIFRSILVLLYLLGGWFVYACYEDARYPTSWLGVGTMLPVLLVFIVLISALLIVGSLWFWHWSTARAFLLLFLINVIAAFLAAYMGGRSWNAEVKRNLAYATTLVARIENHRQTNGHYAAAWTDLGQTNAPVIHRNRTTVSIDYTPTTNATYKLVIPYGYFRYLYNPVTRQWEMHD